MKDYLNPILQQSISRRKRKVETISYTKKLRSKILRRKRLKISPILRGSSKSLLIDKIPESSGLPSTSSSSSCIPGEISRPTTWISIGSHNLIKKPRSARRSREIEEIRGFGDAICADLRISRKSDRIPDEECRRITRSYYRKKESEREVEKKDNGDLGIELSDTSCIESCSGAETRDFCKSEVYCESILKSIDQSGKLSENADKHEGSEASAAISLSEISCIQPSSEEKARNILESLPEKTNRAPESFSEISRNYTESDLAVKNLESTVDQKPKDLDFDYSLACSEDLSSAEYSEYRTSQEMTLSEFESEIFPRNPDVDFSDYTPSHQFESPSDFSGESEGNSTPSLGFSLFLQYKNQFSKLNSPLNIKDSAQVQDECFNDFTLLKFEDEQLEETYKKFRIRERKLILRNFGEKYFSTTEYGDIVIQQRLLMVNWIIEQSSERELQCETMFSGVSLFDRFLGRGFFNHERKLQILGIACLTLAIRIEENQPYNGVRQMTFHVGSNVYSRCEVVAMEWLVQEVLDFQCFLPTTYNFLWFYLKAADADAEVEKNAKYLATLSLLDPKQLCYWPSTVAAGLVILAAVASNQDTSCQWIMETHVRTKEDDLAECIQSLEWLVKYVC